MTTITIELPDDIAAALSKQASAMKTSLAELVADAAEQLLDIQYYPFTEEDRAAIAEGHAQADRGEVVSLEDFLAGHDTAQ
jgi:predicted transcriptional regulator